MIITWSFATSLDTSLKISRFYKDSWQCWRCCWELHIRGSSKQGGGKCDMIESTESMVLSRWSYKSSRHEVLPVFAEQIRRISRMSSRTLIKHRIHGLDPLVSYYVKINIASRWLHPLRCQELHFGHHKQIWVFLVVGELLHKFSEVLWLFRSAGFLGLTLVRFPFRDQRSRRWIHTWSCWKLHSGT